MTITNLSDGVGLGSVLQQQSDDVAVADPGGDVQWRGLFSRLRVGVAAVAQQHPNDVGLIGASRQMQRGFPTNRLNVGGAAMAGEERG